MNVLSILNYVHRFLGRSRLAVRFAILLRNQARCVIKYHLNEDTNQLINGEALLIQAVSSSTFTFIDVGANVGDWTALLLKSAPENIQGLLFDPSDYAIKNLRQRYNQLPNIKVIQAAVSDTPGKMDFFEEAAAGETSSLLMEFSNKNATKKLTNVTTLAIEVEKFQWENIDLLKIDAEGYDLHVLRGAVELLAKHKVGIIQFEYNAPWALAGSSLTAAYNLLESYGYKMFLLKSSGLFEFRYLVYGEFFSYSNFVAVSPYKCSSIQSLIRGCI